MIRPSDRLQVRFRSFPLLLGSALALGAVLRLWELPFQIPGGDEWNALRFPSWYSFGELFHLHLGAHNSVPFSWLYKLLLETTGLTEWSLRAPPLIAGLAAVALFPLLLLPFQARRVIVLFAFLAALSPFLVFYSRFVRPYMISAFLGFASLLFLFHWFESGKRRFAVLYVLTAVTAPFFHLSALPFATAPLLLALLLRAGALPFLRRAAGARLPGLKPLLAVTACTAAGYLLEFLPRLSVMHALSWKVNQGSFTPGTLKGAVHLLTGVSSPTPALVLLFLAAAGMLRTWRRDPFQAALLLSAAAAPYAAVLALRPLGGGYPLVFARYTLCALPVWLLFLAAGLDGAGGMLEKPPGAVLLHRGGRKALLFTGYAGFLAFLLFAGPLPGIYFSCNSFTNFNDYQLHYLPGLMKVSGAVSRTFPAFYRRLAGEKGAFAVIESPYFGFWRILNYPLYQRLHRKRVLIGHPSYTLTVQEDTVMDPRIRLAGFVNYEDRRAMARSGARYILFHKDVLGEFLHVRAACPEYRNFLESVKAKRSLYEKKFGAPARRAVTDGIRALRRGGRVPCYEDEWITVFKLN